MKTGVACFVTFLSTVVSVHAQLESEQHFHGHVLFYQDSWLQGPLFELTFGAVGRCYNIDKCFNDAASSVLWAGIPSAVHTWYYSIVSTYIEFFTDVNCQGLSKSWKIGDYDFPKDFALDGLNDQISSFVVRTSSWNEYYNVQCGRRRRRTLQQEGDVGYNDSLSDGNSSSFLMADCSEDEDGVFYLNETSSDAHNNTVLVDETHASDLEGNEFFRNAISSTNSGDSHGVGP